eukprot:162483-Prymnesium_polylepis.1
MQLLVEQARIRTREHKTARVGLCVPPWRVVLCTRGAQPDRKRDATPLHTPQRDHSPSACVRCHGLCVAQEIPRILTYADYHAIGYFRKHAYSVCLNLEGEAAKMIQECACSRMRAHAAHTSADGGHATARRQTRRAA